MVVRSRDWKFCSDGSCCKLAKRPARHTLAQNIPNSLSSGYTPAPFEAQVGKQRTAMTLLTAHCQPPEPGTSNIGRGVQQQVVLCILEVIASLAAEKQVQDASRCKQCIRRRYWSKEGSRKRATRPSQDILAIES